MTDAVDIREIIGGGGVRHEISVAVQYAATQGNASVTGMETR